jgi:hypothetical protein
LPFPFRELQAPALAMEAHWRLTDLLGYFQTWSGVAAAEKALGRDAIERADASLAKSWDDPLIRRKIRWPLSLRVGHV